LFQALLKCSFDKGFHSTVNQTDLKALIEQVVLPKIGKLSKADQEREYAPEFKQAKKQHSADDPAFNRKARGYSNSSNRQSHWSSLLLPVLCTATVFAFILKDVRLIKLMCELRNRVLNRNTIYFVRIATFFHGLPLIIVKSAPYRHALI